MFEESMHDISTISIDETIAYGFPQTVLFLAHNFFTLWLLLDGAICLADSFEFTIYHYMRLKAFRYERASLNRIAADELYSVTKAVLNSAELDSMLNQQFDRTFN